MFTADLLYVYSRLARVRCLSGRASVLEKDTLSSPKYCLIPRKQWLRPNMTEKLFIVTLNNNQTKTTDLLYVYSRPYLYVV